MFGLLFYLFTKEVLETNTFEKQPFSFCLEMGQTNKNETKEEKEKKQFFAKKSADVKFV